MVGKGALLRAVALLHFAHPALVWVAFCSVITELVWAYNAPIAGENHQGCPKHCISSRDILLYCGSCCVPVNRSALHDEYNPPHGGDVVDRIAFDSNQVRLEARRHGSDLVAEAE
jgi:hypothetical protein